MADNYGQMEKRVVFMENDHRHAQMVLKLKYLRLTQAAFFRHIISGLINDDPRIVEFTNEIALTSKTKKDQTNVSLLQNIILCFRIHINYIA